MLDGSSKFRQTIRPLVSFFISSQLNNRLQLADYWLLILSIWELSLYIWLKENYQTVNSEKCMWSCMTFELWFCNGRLSIQRVVWNVVFCCYNQLTVYNFKTIKVVFLVVLDNMNWSSPQDSQDFSKKLNVRLSWMKMLAIRTRNYCY